MNRTDAARRLLIVLLLAVAPLALARDRGVTLYDGEGFRGRSETFERDEPRLDRGSYLGNDRARSVRVDRGCRVTLFEDADYRGRSVTLSDDEPSLARTRVGLDQVSSLRVDCRGGGWGDGGWDDDGWGDGDRLRRGEGVRLYEHDDFRGRSVTVESDQPRIDRVFRNDTTSSIRVAPGCRAILYRDASYRGTSLELDRDVRDLGDTRLGNDSLSSLRVDCRGGWGDGGWGDGRRGVTLYSDAGFRGREERFYQDDDRLADNRIGNDRVSSVRVDRGCQATLYENDRFTGRSTVVERDEPSLEGSRVGNDRVSSLTVRCFGQGDRPDWGWGDGVVLYEHVDFRGRSESFVDDDGRLSNNRIGNDRASSVRVAPGCRAILYRDADFRGRSVRVTRDIEDLGRTEIGNDSVSSIEVRCRRRR